MCSFLKKIKKKIIFFSKITVFSTISIINISGKNTSPCKAFYIQSNSMHRNYEKKSVIPFIHSHTFLFISPPNQKEIVDCVNAKKAHPKNSNSISSQKNANHFVKEQWIKHPKNHRAHLLASEEMPRLADAYKKKFIKVCGPDQKTINTANFNLAQLYTAYYKAVAAEEYLLSV